jgi:hypothetical protein
MEATPCEGERRKGGAPWMGRGGPLKMDVYWTGTPFAVRKQRCCPCVSGVEDLCIQTGELLFSVAESSIDPCCYHLNTISSQTFGLIHGLSAKPMLLLYDQCRRNLPGMPKLTELRSCGELSYRRASLTRRIFLTDTPRFIHR